METEETPVTTPIELQSVEELEPAPGFRVRFVHTEHMTLAYWNVAAGAALTEHAHPHEQVVNVLEGEFELTLAGTPHRLTPGKVLVIESNVPHAGRAISECRILDVFYPVREDYRRQA